MTKRTLFIRGLGFVIVLGGLSFILSQYIVTLRIGAAITQSRLEIEKQLTTVATVSEVMAQGGVDRVTERVIKDCPVAERNRFDLLLSRLNNGLPRAELQELSRLYDRCASFFARRKAVMASRLVREVEVYQMLTERYLLLSGTAAVDEFNITAWEKLVSLEQDQSEAFEKLVIMQGQIISELIAGRTVVSVELSQLLKDINEVQQLQTYNAVQIAEIRKDLTPI